MLPQDPVLGLIGFVDRAPDGQLWAAPTTGLHRIDDGGRRLRSYGPADGVPAPTDYFAWDGRGRLRLPGDDFVARIENAAAVLECNRQFRSGPEPPCTAQSSVPMVTNCIAFSAFDGMTQDVSRTRVARVILAPQ